MEADEYSLIITFRDKRLFLVLEALEEIKRSPHCCGNIEEIVVSPEKLIRDVVVK